MTDREKYRDPTNRMVCVFNDLDSAEGARQPLLEMGFEEHELFLLRGKNDARRCDTSPKWFADTDQEMEWYEQALEAGSTVLSIPIADAEARQQAHQVVKTDGAHLVTHFGQWVTEMLK